MFGWWVDARCGETEGFVRKIDTLQDIEVTEREGRVQVSQIVFVACDMFDYAEASGADLESALPAIPPELYCAYDVPSLGGCL